MYKVNDTVILRTQQKYAVDGEPFTVFYPDWDGLLACEGQESVVLSREEAEALNTYDSFTRN